MEITVWTWGTGSAFGRELGIPTTRERRHHASTSIIGQENGETKFHIMVDAIDNGVSIPDVLFVTHSHADHISDLDKLVSSRPRGLSLLGKPWGPFPIICTRECMDDPQIGLKSKFSYLGNTVQWWPIRMYDVWYSIRATDAFLLPTQTLSRRDFVLPVKLKALPVYHGFAPGACLFIFALHDESKKIVISGDFESINETTVAHPDLRGPNLILLDANTIKAIGTNHTNWEQNKYLIKRWATGSNKTQVVLHHLGGFEDYMQGYYDHIPTNQDWKREIKAFKPPKGTTVSLARDGMQISV
jgi:ribonuclease BN (tRNA processing enzyme)